MNVSSSLENGPKILFLLSTSLNGDVTYEWLPTHSYYIYLIYSHCIFECKHCLLCDPRNNFVVYSNLNCELCWQTKGFLKTVSYYSYNFTIALSQGLDELWFQKGFEDSYFQPTHPRMKEDKVIPNKEALRRPYLQKEPSKQQFLCRIPFQALSRSLVRDLKSAKS